MQKIISSLLLACLGYNTCVIAEMDDPMRPVAISTHDTAITTRDIIPENNKWYLHSILISDQRKVAIINGRPVSVGDQVDGARVINIDKESVELSRLDRRIRLQMHALAIKKKRKE